MAKTAHNQPRSKAANKVTPIKATGPSMRPTLDRAKTKSTLPAPAPHNATTFKPAP